MDMYIVGQLIRVRNFVKGLKIQPNFRIEAFSTRISNKIWNCNLKNLWDRIEYGIESYDILDSIRITNEVVPNLICG